MRLLQRNLARGFNLVEAAIVLGVVGLVIGGIWVAAASVTQKRQITNMSTGILTLVQGLRNSMAGQTYPNSGLWLNELAINSKLLPANWTSNGSLTIFAEQGSAVNLTADYDLTEFATSNGHGLTVVLDAPLSNSLCINLVAAITSRFRDQSNLVYVAIGSATYLRSFPADMATITANCVSRGGNQALNFAFRP